VCKTTQLLFVLYEKIVPKPNNLKTNMKILQTFFFLLLLTWTVSLQAQDTTRVHVDSVEYYKDYIMYKTNDSIPVLDLDSVYLLPKIRFRDYKELKYYRWIRRKVYKVYPFAKLTAETFDKIDERIAKMNKRRRKKYLKNVQKWIEKEFEPKLKQLTQTEGRILSKLVYRQTGNTVFELLKKYKSGWTAFWYQRLAKLFNVDLKVKYNPENVKLDYWIEDILQHAFQDEILEYQPNKLGFKFINLRNKWQPKRIPRKKGKLKQGDLFLKKMITPKNQNN
jgi:hypothetical protein